MELRTRHRGTPTVSICIINVVFDSAIYCRYKRVYFIVVASC